LGFEINSHSMTLTIPKSKIRDIRREVTKMHNRGTATLKTLSSFIGKALAMTAAVLPACLHTCNHLQLKNQSLLWGHQWTDWITLTQPVIQNLLF
jgi:hypothetical protein